MEKNGKGFIRPTIRGLDPELYKRAKADAALQDKDIGAWMNEAIATKLGLYQAKFYIDEKGYPTLEDNQGSKAVLKEGGWTITPAEKKHPAKAGGAGGPKT